MSLPDSLPGHLLRSLAADGAAPKLTWYGAGGERVELSGRVLTNWVTKAANLLVDLADAGPGTDVVMDLPVHWRTLIWTLAAWTAGAGVRLDPTGRPADVVVTAAPDAAPEGAEVLAVALPALAMSWDGSDLPAGVTDAAAELPGYGDVLGYVVEPDGDAPALPDVAFDALTDWAATGAHRGEDPAEGDEAARVLLTPSSVSDLLRGCLGIWLAGGSAVLVAASRSDADRIAEDERVDRRAESSATDATH